MKANRWHNRNTVNKGMVFLLTTAFLLYCLSGCADADAPISSEPVTLTMWHVYGSQTESPMNELVDVFNSTVGAMRGITVNVTSVSNSTAIHDALLASAADEPGAGDIPDVFVCYPKTAAAIGAERLMDWNEHFTKEELAEYVPEFLKEGVIDGRQTVFPIAKSSEVLFINTTVFDRFSADTGLTYSDLSTYEGFFDAAMKYGEWSRGKAFFQYDSWFNYFLINTASLGGSFVKDEGVDLFDPAFVKVWAAVSDAASAGAVCLDDGYSTTAMMTGEAVCGIESTASILYFKDTVTYPDNSTEPLTLRALPTPVFEGAAATVVQRGVGLCAMAGDEKKELAAAVFCKWLTETENNLGFVTSTGYMPVKAEAYEALFTDGTEYASESYRSLYMAIGALVDGFDFYTPPVFDTYGAIEKRFDKAMKTVLRSAAGKNSRQTLKELVAEMR